MKIALVSVLVFAVVVGAIVATMLAKPADNPTTDTVGKLGTTALPGDLPSLRAAEEPEPRAVDVAQRLADLSALIAEDRDAWLPKTQPPEDPELDRAEAIVLDLSMAPKLPAHFLDDQMTFAHDSRPEGGAPIQMAVNALTIQRINDYRNADNVAAAERLALALVRLGHKIYQSNDMLVVRELAMGTMWAGLEHLRQLPADGATVDRDAVLAWHRAVKDSQSQVRAKLRIVFTPNPHIGDLINIAQNDVDPVFRAQAIAAMGWAQHNPGHAGNLRVIKRVINAGLSDEHPRIRAAAEFARDFTAEDVRRMR